ncbi:hypothetical protein C8R44DRAFT_88359 [Mycena epipterygia]|nr:hypothetical protein C8R44DRAFT_88359 [Mycena epipterygia]
MAYDTRPRSKEFAAEWRHFPESRPLRPTFSPEPSLRHVYEERHGPDPGNGTYYIVPGGMNVVFQDKTGNEITRVGDFSGRRRRISPIIVQDEYGRELYRTSDVQNSNRTSHPRDEPIYHRSRRTRQDEGLRYDTSRHSDSRSRSAEPPRDRYFQRSDSERSYSREPPTIVLIDGSGRQIPMSVTALHPRLVLIPFYQHAARL